jgi:hypothetical protein
VLATAVCRQREGDGRVRHLTEQQALAALHRRLAVRLHHTRDDGSPDFLDVDEFHPVEQDEERGDGSLDRTVPRSRSCARGRNRD